MIQSSSEPDKNQSSNLHLWNEETRCYEAIYHEMLLFYLFKNIQAT